MSDFKYDTAPAPFSNDADVNIPPKPAKQEKKKAAEKPIKEVSDAIKNLELPTLKLGRYVDVAPYFAARAKKYVTRSEAREAIVDEAWRHLNTMGVIRHASAVDELSKPVATEKVTKKQGEKLVEETVSVSKIDLYKRTEGGKLILEEIRKKDQALKAASDVIVKAFIKSEAGDKLGLFKRWQEVREKKIITDQTQSLLTTLCKHVIGSTIRDLISYRARQMRADTSGKGPQIIGVDTNTVKAFVGDTTNVRSSFPLASYFYRELGFLAVHFPEPIRKGDAAATSDEQIDDFVSVKAMINDIIQIERNEIVKKQEAAGQKAPAIRTTDTLKELLNHSILQLCDKVLRGLHVYTACVNKRNGVSAGVKIDNDELHGRLLQLIFDSTDNFFSATVRASEMQQLEVFLEAASADYEALSSFDEKYNLIKYAERLTKQESKDKDKPPVIVSTEDVLARREKKRLELEAKELKANAEKEKVSIEQYKVLVEARKQERAKKAAEAKELAAADEKKRLGETAAENEKRWKDKLEEYKKIIAELALVAPPPPTALVIGAEATPAPASSGSATPATSAA